MIVPAILLVPALALLVSLGQQKVYEANAQVLISYANPAASLNGVVSTVAPTPDRVVATQAALARDPSVAQRALSLSGVHSTTNDFLNHSSVSTPTNADLLNFSVSNSNPVLASRLATNYAKAYTIYRGQLDSQAIDAGLADVTHRLAQLARTGQTGSPTYATLSHEQQVLTATQAAATNDAELVQPAATATKTSPQPGRNAAIGLVLGIALAVLLAVLLEGLDPQVDSVEEIERRLGLPLLARIPAPRGWRGGAQPLATLRGFAEDRERRLGRDHSPAARSRRRDSESREAAAFRALMSNLQFASLEHELKSIMFTCGRDYEGKATTIANLAITLVQSGRRVLLCDLDARNAEIGELFGLGGHPGLKEVVLGQVPLEEAVARIAVTSRFSWAPTGEVDAPSDEARATELPPSGNIQGSAGVLPFGAVAPEAVPPLHHTQGLLEVLPFGEGLPSDPGFLDSRAVSGLLDELKHASADHVLINAPALIPQGDTPTLSGRVAGVVLALAAPVRRPMLDELARVMGTSLARPIGFIAVGAFRDGGFGIGEPSYHLEQVSPSGIGRNGHGSMPHTVAHG